MDRIKQLELRQEEFQRAVGFPIYSIAESDRNEMSEKYVFKLIEEAVELRKEFPSVVNPWSKKQKSADIQRIKEEFSDVVLFLLNIAIVWRFRWEEILDAVEQVQENNFRGLKQKKMDLLNADILKIQGKTSGVGQGNLSPKYVFVGQNPGLDITQGYKFWSNISDGSSKVLLPAINKLKIHKDCYFTNLVKCTTENNDLPSKEMVAFYREFLIRELDILALGNPGMLVITMGKWTDENIGLDHRSIPHPASVIYGSTDDVEYRNKIHDAIT